MRIILINPPSEGVDDDRLEPQLGLLYIASVLREEGGHEVQIYEMTGCKNEGQVEDKIKNIPYGDVYGFTVYCTNYKFVKRCIRYIRRKHPRAYIILGGPNPTALPEFTLKDSGADFVIKGEGEDAFLHVVTSLCAGYIPGISMPRIIEGWGRENLDDYPLPAWDLIDLNSFTRVLEGDRIISIISSRGCPNHCLHCNSIVMGAGKKIRYRSPENVVKEIKYLKALGYDKFRFSDDNFTIRPDLSNLLEKLREENIEYRIFARVTELNDEVCQQLSESGCRSIAVGLESLNPDNLRFLRKYGQAGKEKNLWNAKKYGIPIRCYFIVGLPFDTDKTIKQYFEEAGDLPFDEWTCYPLIPYPGTEIYNHPERYGYEIVNNDFTKYFQIGQNKSTCYALNHTNFNERDVERWVNYVNELFESRGKIHTGDSKVMK